MQYSPGGPHCVIFGLIRGVPDMGTAMDPVAGPGSDLGSSSDF